MPKRSNIIFPKKEIKVINGRKSLPKNWTDVVVGEISKIENFSCCVKFIRHFVLKTGNYLFSFDFGCTIEDCRMKGKAVIRNNFQLHVEFLENFVVHKKDELNSYKARKLHQEERAEIGKELEYVMNPSRKYHALLSDDNKTNMECGCLSITSKNVCRQAKYEWKKKQLPNKDILKSLQILQKRYQQQFSQKEIRGYIQNLNVFPLLLGLWTEEDVDLYHEQVKQYPLIVDATCGIASKVNESRVYYYAFIFYNRNVKILTDQPDEMCLTNALNYFLDGVKRKYGPNCGSKPLVVVWS